MNSLPAYVHRDPEPDSGFTPNTIESLVSEPSPNIVIRLGCVTAKATGNQVTLASLAPFASWNNVIECRRLSGVVATIATLVTPCLKYQSTEMFSCLLLPDKNSVVDEVETCGHGIRQKCVDF